MLEGWERGQGCLLRCGSLHCHGSGLGLKAGLSRFLAVHLSLSGPQFSHL